MLRQLFLLYNLLFLLGAEAWGQTLTVRDQLTLEPLEFVSISSPAQRLAVQTDARGQADISAFQNVDSLRIHLIGHRSQVLSFAQLAKDGFQVFLAEDQILLREIVVSANRWEQDRREVPFRIAAIRARDVAFQQPQTAADLLGLSGQVFIQKSQLGGGSPMIRGFSANRVLIVVDGVRMNNAIFRSGNLQNVISLDPLAIQNTEVIFGPTSMIYGSDAIGGIMDFHTLEPRLSQGENTLFTGNALLRYSCANEEKTGHLDLQYGGPRWAGLSSFSYSDFGDLRMGSHGPDEYLRPFFARRVNGKDEVLTNPDPQVQVSSGYSQYNLMQKIRFQPSANWDFQYGLHLSATSDVPRYDRLVELRNGLPRDGQWYYGPQRWLMNNLQISHKQEKGWFDQMRLIAAHQYFQESRHDRRFQRNALNHRVETVNALTFNLDLDKKLSPKLDLFYGAEAVFNQVGSEAEEENIATGEVSPLSTRYPDGSTWNTYAAYASVKANLNPRLTLLGGLRYNQVALNAEFDTQFFPFPFTETKINQGALTGSAGLTYRPQPSLQLNFNLSTGFRAPNIDDAGKVFDSAPGLVVAPNPNLRPEYAYSADLGFIKTFGERLRVDVNGFYTLLDNALVRRDFEFNGQDSILYDGELSRVQAIQNAAEAWVWGIQAGVEYLVGGGFSLSARYNWQDGKEEDEVSEANVPARHVAPSFGLVQLQYRANRFQASLYSQFNGEISYESLAPTERDKPHLYAIDENGNPYCPAWYTLNLKASYQLGSVLQLNLGLENISDQRYRPYSSGIVAPGRNLIVGLRVGL